MRSPRYVFFALLPLVSLAAAEAAARTLTPHRAVYDLALAGTSDESEIESLEGRWVFEFSGSACEGYTLKSRIVMHFEMAAGPSLIDQQVTSFEDAAGETLRFVTKSFIDQELESEVMGTAARTPSGTVVEYEKPEEAERTFGPALYPTGQLRELLQKAQAGDRFYQTSIFDGTEFADRAMMVSVVLGAPKPVGEGDPERKALGQLAKDDFFPVTVAYFDGEEASGGEETSDYNVSFKLHEGGVQRDMMIRYDEYSMTAKLVDLSLFESDRTCEAD